MKKYGLLCLIFLALAAVIPAAADSVWMPMDDYFFETWNPESENTCESQTRKIFLAAGEDGYVTAVRTPLDHTELKTYPNGTEFQIDFICGVGDDLWGTVRSVRLPGENVFTEDYTGASGYIPRKDLVHAYDSDAFTELHSNSIFGFTDDFNPCEPHFPFVIWSYPGSGVQLSLVSDSVLDWFCHDWGWNSEYYPLQFGPIYYAEDGTRWVHVHQLKPNTFGWLNYDDPMAGAIIGQY